MRFDNIKSSDHEIHFIGTPKYADGFPLDVREKFYAFSIIEEMNYEFISLYIEIMGVFDSIVCFSEEDLYLAAALRERYRIAGPVPEQIRPFRDKYTMKLRVSEAGIKTPNFGLFQDLADTLQERNYECASARYGVPFVLKPRIGMANQGIFIISSFAEFERVSCAIRHELSTYMIESYVAGDMYHVDSLLTENGLQMYASRYTVPQLHARKGPTGSVTLDEKSDEALSLFAVNRQVLDALQLPLGCAHAEYFRTEKGEIVFCEVGARIGGTQVIPMLERVHGVNLAQKWFTAETGLIYRSDPTSCYPCGGFVDFPILPHSRLDAVVPALGLDDVELVEARVKPGYVSGAQKLEQNRAVSFFVGGSCPEEVRTKIDRLIECSPLRWTSL